MDNVIERFEHAGLEVQIGYEETDLEHFNPRTADDGNLGTMVCWHPDYALGDFQLRENRGAVGAEYDHGWGRDGAGFKSMRHLARYLELVEHAVVVIPLYLYDHSGISISAGAPNPFDNPRVRRDDLGASLGWDSSLVGFIYTTPSRVAELCGSEYYVPADFGGDQAAWLVKSLKCEVDVYDQYLQGQVYWYGIGEDYDSLDECVGGFLGGGLDADGKELDGLAYCIQEAKEAAEALAKARREEAEREAREAGFWANRDVATIGGA